MRAVSSTSGACCVASSTTLCGSVRVHVAATWARYDSGGEARVRGAAMRERGGTDTGTFVTWPEACMPRHRQPRGLGLAAAPPPMCMEGGFAFTCNELLPSLNYLMMQASRPRDHGCFVDCYYNIQLLAS